MWWWMAFSRVFILGTSGSAFHQAWNQHLFRGLNMNCELSYLWMLLKLSFFIIIKYRIKWILNANNWNVMFRKSYYKFTLTTVIIILLLERTTNQETISVFFHHPAVWVTTMERDKGETWPSWNRSPSGGLCFKSDRPSAKLMLRHSLCWGSIYCHPRILLVLTNVF